MSSRDAPNDSDVLNWFEVVAMEAEAAQGHLGRLTELQRVKQKSSAFRRSSVSAAQLADALGGFGLIPPSHNASRAEGCQKVSRDQALGALKLIEEHVRQAEDPFQAAGEWMTRVTNALSVIARESQQD